VLRYAAPVILISILLASASAAYGHGLGADQSLPVAIGNRQVAVQAAINPSSFEEAAAGSRPVFTARAFEPSSNSTISDLDYDIKVDHNGAVLLDQKFHSGDGLVIANLVPDAGASGAQVNGKPAGGRVEVGKGNPATITSKILSDGGLYHVAVTLEKSSAGLQLDGDKKFDLYISISKKQDFVVQTPEGAQKMSTTTYYADVTDLAFNNGTLTFAMPFDWRPEYVSQVPLVHMEVQFPKAVKELQVNGYSGSVNGVALPADAILVDDYSFEDSRVVHFVLNSDRLSSLAQKVKGDSMVFALAPADKPKFPLDIMSTTEKYMWELSWGPEVIQTGTPTTFVMNIQDPKVADLVRNASFDFVLEKAGKEVYRQHLTSGQGTFSLDYTFAEAGTYRLAAENINGSGESAQRNIVVLQGSAAPAPAPVPAQKPSGCLIATAAFGSELTPQVQLLRGFRDNYILKSQSGSAFMDAFDAVYYSFSPQVADYERQQPWLQSTVKAGLYPLFGILLVSQQAFSAAGGDAGAVLAGATASALIGAVYVAPAVAGVTVAKKKHVGVKPVAVALAAALASLAATAAGLYVGNEAALSVATSLFVVTSAATAALAIAKLVVGRLR
jgi:peptide/nickel transport system substrate-binding protein